MMKVKNILGLLFVASMFVFAACSDDDDEPKAVTPAKPVLNNATEVTATGFKISWAAVASAESYLMDVSLEADFDPTITGYAKKAITGTTHTLAGLNDDTKYYVRLYAKNGSRVSEASVAKEVTTAEAP